MPAARWVLPPAPNATISNLARNLEVSHVTATLLARRLSEPTIEQARSFLRPTLKDLHSPWSLPDMTPAAERIALAVRQKQNIVIYGDYDTDGVTATALLVRIFQALGISATPYLPSRMEEGYGISHEFTAQSSKDTIDLVITVDCGTTEHEKIDRLTAKGIDVIVTDHHEPGDLPLPEALAVVNPKRKDSAYPFKEITGVGVAFKLAWAICEKIMGSPRVGQRLQETLIGLLPLVAIGSIADVAPLIDENRIYTIFGLRSLNRPLPGIAALMEKSRLKAEKVSARDIAFSIAPRLNSAGRMGDAKLALDLLIEDDLGAAANIARELEQHNSSRQKLCLSTKQEALAMVRQTHDLGHDSVIVIAGEGWHEGVIGIVAGRLAEEFHKPALVIAIDQKTGKGKGSARSIDRLDLFKAMSNSHGRFLTFGGHEQAAGFSIMRDQIDGLRMELDAQCKLLMEQNDTYPRLEIDAEIGLSSLSGSLVHEIMMLGPFGHGNPEPRLLTRNVSVVGEPRIMGRDNQHFSFRASQHKVAYRAVVFNNTEWLKRIDAGARNWDLVFSPQLNDHKWPPRLELRIVDMRECDER